MSSVRLLLFSIYSYLMPNEPRKIPFRDKLKKWVEIQGNRLLAHSECLGAEDISRILNLVKRFEDPEVKIKLFITLIEKLEKFEEVSEYVSSLGKLKETVDYLKGNRIISSYQYILFLCDIARLEHRVTLLQDSKETLNKAITAVKEFKLPATSEAIRNSITDTLNLKVLELCIKLELIDSSVIFLFRLIGENNTDQKIIGLQLDKLMNHFNESIKHLKPQDKLSCLMKLYSFFDKNLEMFPIYKEPFVLQVVNLISRIDINIAERLLERCKVSIKNYYEANDSFGVAYISFMIARTEFSMLAHLDPKKQTEYVKDLRANLARAKRQFTERNMRDNRFVDLSKNIERFGKKLEVLNSN